MSGNNPVDPYEIPHFTGDFATLDLRVKSLSGASTKIPTAAGDVHTTFGGLRAYYKAPEAEQLFSVTEPVKSTAQLLGSDLAVIAGALRTYAQDAEPLAKQLDALRAEAQAFRTQVADDDEWREDGDLIDENLERRNKVAEVWAAFQDVEMACHAKIVALVGGTPLKKHDGSGKQGMYGYNAEALKQAKSLPWGDAVEESTPGWQVWEHAGDFFTGFFVDGVWGTIQGLGTLAGFYGWDAAGQAWDGLGKLVMGVALASSPIAGSWYMSRSDDELPAWMAESRTAMKETGKALLAWDDWDAHPGRAAGAVTFNVVTTVFTGGAGGAAASAGKAGAAARALAIAGKVSRAVDPMTYVFKGAGAGLTKLGNVMAGLKGMGRIEVPPLPEGAIALPPGAYKLSDGTLHLPEGAAMPEGAFAVPARTVLLPEGAPVPRGAVDLGDGMVQLPRRGEVPAGSVAVPESTIKVPGGATALPPGTASAGTGFFSPEGHLLAPDGSLLQHADDAPKATAPATGVDASSPVPPVRQPALVGAGDDATRLGPGLGDDGIRLGDDTPGTFPDRTPGGEAGDNMPTNSLENGATRPGFHGPSAGALAHSPSGPAGHTIGSQGTPVPVSNLDSGLPGGRTGRQLPGSSTLDGLGHHGDDAPDPDDAEGPSGERALTESDAGSNAVDGARGAEDASSNPYTGQEPDFSRPALMPADGPLTLRDVRNIRDPERRWQSGEELHRQMWGGGPERAYPVPMRNEGRYPVTTPGGRKVDVPVDLPDGRTVAVEVKTYGEYRTITLKDGTKEAVQNEVPLSKAIKEQIHKDIALREENPGFDPRWSFTHAGPSKELRDYLTQARIIFLEYGPAPKKGR